MEKALPALLTGAIGWSLFQIVVCLADLPLHYLVKDYPAIGPFGSVAGALAVLSLYRWRSRPSFRGMLWEGHPAEALGLNAAFFVYLPLTALSELVIFSAAHTPPTLETVSKSFVAGFGEELCFRGLLLSELMRLVRRREELLPAALLSALCFGAVHAANLLLGANPAATLLQVVSASFIGFFWAAAFLRCGSLWPCILSHVLLDVIALLTVSQKGGVLTGGIDPGTAVDALLRLGLCIVGLWLLRQEKREEILALWGKKWGKA